MLRVQDGDVKLFDWEIFHSWSEVLDDITRRPNGRPVLTAFGRHASPQLERRMNRHRTSHSDTGDRRQRRDRLASDPSQRPARFHENRLANLDR
jgi:hypothetical protein